MGNRNSRVPGVAKASPSICKLPVELCGEIVRHVDSVPDLHRLLFVSRIFHEEVETRLYKFFVVKLRNRPAHIQSFRALTIDNPSIASKLLRLDLQNIPTADKTLVSVSTRWTKFLPEAYQALENLRELRLPIRAAECTPPPSVTFRLRVLVSPIYRHGESALAMLSFLKSQDTIETLVHPPGVIRTPLNLPPELLPNLVRLCARGEVARSILSGRRVQSLFTADHLIATPALRYIQRLAIYGIELDELASYSQCFPMLRYLETEAESLANFLDVDLSAMVSLESLNVVVQNGTHGDEETLCAGLLFAKFPRLRRIECTALRDYGFAPPGTPCKVWIKGGGTFDGTHRVLVDERVDPGAWDETL